MLETQYYNVIKAVVYIVAAIIPSYFILRSRNTSNNNNHLRKITIILLGFILMQIFYHIVGALGFRILAKGGLEPLSMAVLLIFGIIYLVTTLRIKNKNQQQQQQQFKK